MLAIILSYLEVRALSQKRSLILIRLFFCNKLYIWILFLKYTVRTPMVDPFPIEDPSMKIQIEDLFLFSKKCVWGVLY